MSIEHATVRDLSEYLVGVVLLGLLLVPPGFVVGWWGNVLDFRRRPLSGQLCLALLLSLALCPIVTHLLATFAGLPVVWIAYAVAGLSLPVVLWQRTRAETTPDEVAFWPLMLASIAWTVLAGYALVDLETSAGLTRCLAHYDHAKHAAVTDAVLRTGVPPANPSFHPGEARPLYYYYYWQMLCGLAGRLGGDLVTPRTLAISGVAWGGFALLAVVHLYLSLARTRQTPGLYLLGFGLLLVTGLDILPVLSRAQTSLMPHIEWWNNNQVSAWIVVGIWVPHHLVALTVVLLCWLLLREAGVSGSARQRAGLVLLAGLALASAFGLSIWVTLMAVLGLGVWWLVALVRRMWSEVALVPLIGLVFALSVLPFVLELKQAQPEARFPLAFEVRDSPLLAPVQEALGRIHPLLRSAFHVVMLPVQYGVEFGVFLLAGVLFWREKRRSGVPWSRDELFLLVMTLTSVVAGSFICSAIRNNDFGWRGMLLAQFCLLLALVHLLRRPAESAPPEAASPRLLLYFLILLGLAGSGYELLVARHFTSGDDGPEALQLRQAYTWIRRHTPREAVVQQSWQRYRAPTGGGLDMQFEGQHEYFHLLYGHRQAAVSDEMHGMLFGISRAQFDAVAPETASLFESGLSREQVAALCQRYGIDVLVVKRADPVALDPAGWANQTRPVFANDAARVYFLDRFDALTGP